MAQVSTTTFDLLGYGIEVAAQNCTADGTTIVGLMDGRVYRWTEASGPQFLSDPDSRHIFRAENPDDGAAIVSNTFDSASGGFSAGFWNEASGRFRVGGLSGSVLVDGSISSGRGVSGDGTVVTGFAWVSGARAEAFRSTQATGTVSLGREPDASSRATNLSADGSVIYGEAFNTVTQESVVFRATLTPCAGIFEVGLESGDTTSWSAVEP